MTHNRILCFRQCRVFLGEGALSTSPMEWWETEAPDIRKQGMCLAITVGWVGIMHKTASSQQWTLHNKGRFVWNTLLSQRVRTQGTNWCVRTGLDLHLPQCVKTLDVRCRWAKMLQYHFRGASTDQVWWVASLKTSCQKKNHLTVDLCKGMLKEECTFFVFFMLFASSVNIWNTWKQNRQILLAK